MKAKDSTQVNGCGACVGLFRWVKPPHHEFFRNECILHDELYNLGGTEADRYKADARLFDDLRKHSTAHFDGRPHKIGSQVWFIVLAYLYFKAVRWLGWMNFNYKEKAPR